MAHLVFTQTTWKAFSYVKSTKVFGGMLLFLGHRTLTSRGRMDRRPLDGNSTSGALLRRRSFRQRSVGKNFALPVAYRARPRDQHLRIRTELFTSELEMFEVAVGASQESPPLRHRRQVTRPSARIHEDRVSGLKMLTALDFLKNRGRGHELAIRECVPQRGALSEERFDRPCSEGSCWGCSFIEMPRS